MFILIILVILIITIYSVIISNPAYRNRILNSKQIIAQDGHLIPKDKDISCENQFGHLHSKNNSSRYIVHEEPETGYVVLNGVKRKIEDCKYL